MRTLQLVLAYDGAEFHGWQRQPNCRTVQGTVEQALAEIVGASVDVHGASRTDSGVHAFGQAASIELDSPLACDVLRRALVAKLPFDVTVIDVLEMPPGFRATRDAARKRYRYLFLDGRREEVFQPRRAWRLYDRLDVPAMHRAAQGLVGTFDFRSFQSTGSPREDTVRTMFSLDVRRQAAAPSAWPASSAADDLIVFEVVGDRFLYNMVRTMAGTLAEVGRGRRAESWPATAVAALDRRAAGPTAPAHGLYLVEIEMSVAPLPPSSLVAPPTEAAP